MATGLYLEGNDIMFDAQKVGELTITEGDSLHCKIADWFDTTQAAFRSGYSSGFSIGYSKCIRDKDV